MTLTLSVVVPVKDEAENVERLAREIAAAVARDASVEIVFVDDGSADDTLPRLLRLKSELPALRVFRHTRNGGQSRALRTGVRAARAGMIVTLDGDGQNDPGDIARVLAPFHADSGASRIGMVSGIRKRRRDSLGKRLASRLANSFRRGLLEDGATDTGCGLKAFRRDAFLSLPYFDHMHRYLAALMLREGYEVRFVDVRHRPRLYGQSKYGVWDRFLVGVQDIFGVLWLKKRYRAAVEAMEL
jgi:dolichol-phosphate mannosyltransferase